MKMPIIVVSYGNFADTKKLFSYEEFGVTNMPVFTRPVIAALFVSSAKVAMGEILQDKPRLMTQLCSEASFAIDMFETIGSFHPEMRIQLNPRPLTEEALLKFHSSGEDEDPVAYTIEEAIEAVQESNGL